MISKKLLVGFFFFMYICHMETVYIKNELIFNHIVDDTAIKIIHLGDDLFVWIQYGPTEGGLAVDMVKSYTESEIRNIIENFPSYTNNISALDVFNKFITK